MGPRPRHAHQPIACRIPYIALMPGMSAAGGGRHAGDADVRAGGIGKTSRRRLRVLTQPDLPGTAPNGRRQSILQQRLTRDRMFSEAPGTSCAHLKVNGYEAARYIGWCGASSHRRDLDLSRARHRAGNPTVEDGEHLSLGHERTRIRETEGRPKCVERDHLSCGTIAGSRRCRHRLPRGRGRATRSPGDR